jgi:hypothetical protein
VSSADLRGNGTLDLGGGLLTVGSLLFEAGTIKGATIIASAAVSLFTSGDKQLQNAVLANE